MKHILRNIAIFLIASALAVQGQDRLPYTTYTSFSQILKDSAAQYPVINRVSDPGSSTHRAYTGFFFYQCLQFDGTGRYLLGMKVHFQNRVVEPADRGEIGIIDLKDKYK